MQTEHRFSVQDYYRMAEWGVLKPGARVELLDGTIIDMAPIGPFHCGVVNRLNRIFTEHSEERWITSVQNPVRLDDHSEPQPDMLLLRPSPDDYTSRHPRPEEVFLLVEVSDTTLETDRERKLPAYARAGIAEVWIVNLDELTVEVFREPNFTGYGAKAILRAGGTVHPQAFPDVTVDVAELLRR
ncbi:MAG: Uma2 family endonuclease [Verrucomicrobiota bacterium]|jgi:Uma2 family endonuclease